MHHPNRSVFNFIAQVSGLVQHVAGEISVADALKCLMDSPDVNAMLLVSPSIDFIQVTF